MTTTLLRGGPVYSPADPFATALLIDDDTVAWVGSADAAIDAAAVVELGGALVTPAFVDAHVHATAAGLALTGLDLSTARSLHEVLAGVAAAARAGRGRVVFGSGWDETGWPERRPPSPGELDRAGDGALVYLAHADGCDAAVSSGLLAAVSEAPANGRGGLVGDHPTRFAAHRALRRAAHAAVSAPQRRDAQRAARARAAALGVGCLHEMGGPDLGGEPDLLDLLALARDEPGPHVVGYWGELGAAARARELGAHGCGGDLLVDGPIGCHAALLSTPYADAPTRGHGFLDADDVAAHVVACVGAGLQAGVSAVGDGALAVVRDGLARVAQRAGVRVPAGGVRVEHAECPDEATVAAFASYGVVVSVQPARDATWGGPAGLYAARLGTARAGRTNPFAALAAAGVPLAFGSGAPLTPLAPWAGVRAAVRHTRPLSRLSARAAFAAHTRGGWRALGPPVDPPVGPPVAAPVGAPVGAEQAGVLVPGAPATLAVWAAGDLVVQAPDPRVAAWSTDPRAGVPGLPDLDRDPPVCLRTVVRGRTIYEREGALS